MLPATAVTAHRDQLGEGPHWDGRAGELIHVDIANGLVRGWSPAGSEARELARLDAELSAAIPREDGGLLLAAGHDLVLCDAGGERRAIASVETDLDHTRFNDCRCDPRGRLFAGTMSKRRIPGTAALYQLVAGGELERVVAGTTISNGLGWSPDGERMYFIDSLTQSIDVFDYDLGEGSASGRRSLARVDPADGLPDGLTVDAEGCIWVCLFGGGALRRYAPDGALEEHVPLPVTNPTCPAFGDEDLGTLYVTSARHRLDASQLAAEPLAGALLALRPSARGRPGQAFAG